MKTLPSILLALSIAAIGAPAVALPTIFDVSGTAIAGHGKAAVSLARFAARSPST